MQIPSGPPIDSAKRQISQAGFFVFHSFSLYRYLSPKEIHLLLHPQASPIVFGSVIIEQLVPGIICVAGGGDCGVGGRAQSRFIADVALLLDDSNVGRFPSLSRRR